MTEKDCMSGEEKKWLELYRIEQERYHNAIGYFNTHLRFVSSFVAAIVGGSTYLGTAIGPEYGLAIALVVGGFLTSFFTRLGLALVESGYKHWLQTITTLSKYERLLGLHDRRESDQLFDSESIVYPGHVKSLHGNILSERFVEDRMRHGMMKKMKWASCWLVTLGGLAFLTGVVLLLKPLLSRLAICLPLSP